MQESSGVHSTTTLNRTHPSNNPSPKPENRIQQLRDSHLVIPQEQVARYLQANSTSYRKCLAYLALEAIMHSKKTLGTYVCYLDRGQRFLAYLRRPGEIVEVPIKKEGSIDSQVREIRRKHFMVLWPLEKLEGASALLKDPLIQAVVRQDQDRVSLLLKTTPPAKYFSIYSVAVLCAQDTIAQQILRKAKGVLPLKIDQPVIDSEAGLRLLSYGTWDQIQAGIDPRRTFTKEEAKALFRNRHPSINPGLQQALHARIQNINLLDQNGSLKSARAQFNEAPHLVTVEQLIWAWKRFPEMRYEIEAVRGETVRMLGLTEHQAVKAQRLDINAIIHQLEQGDADAFVILLKGKTPVNRWPDLSVEQRKSVIHAVAKHPQIQPRILEAVLFAGSEQEVQEILNFSGWPGMKDWNESLLWKGITDLISTRAIVPFGQWTQLRLLLEGLTEQRGIPFDAAEEDLIEAATARGIPELLDLLLKHMNNLPHMIGRQLIDSAIQSRDPKVFASLHQSNAIPEFEALEKAIKARSDWAVKWLARYPQYCQNRKKMQRWAEQDGLLTSYRTLSKDGSLNKFKLAGLTLEQWREKGHRQEFETALYSCFLNSSYRDWIQFVGIVQDDPVLGKSVLALQSEIEGAGSLIARFPDARHQESIKKEYGKKGVSYEEQQRRYAQNRENVYQRLRLEMKKHNLPLVEAYTLLAQGRDSNQHLFQQFRACKSEGNFATPIIDTQLQSNTRYRHFYPVVWTEAQKRIQERTVQLKPEGYQAAVSLQTGLPVTIVKEGKWDQGPNCDFALYWLHTHFSVLPDLQDQLSSEFEKIKALNGQDVPALKQAIGLFYAKLCHSALTQRGNAQYALEIHRLLYELHGYQIAPPSREAALPDCYALSCTPQQFVKKYYDMCFAKFFETEDIVRPIKKS